MHVLKNVSLKTPRLCKITQFLHRSVHSGVDKTDFLIFLEDYDRYKVEIFSVNITCDGLSHDILHVKVIQNFL